MTKSRNDNDANGDKGAGSAPAAESAATSSSAAATSSSAAAAASAAKAGSSKVRMRQEFESLQKEMEIVEYAKSHNGQYRKRVPRKEQTIRSIKRKILEKKDVQEFAIHGEQETRLRGSKAAIGDRVIQGSLVFQDPAATQPMHPDSDDELLLPALKMSARDDDDFEDDNFEDDDEEEDDDYDDDAEVIDVDEGDDEGDDEIIIDNDDERNLEEDDNIDVDVDDAGKDETPTRVSNKAVPARKNKRRMYRLKNFQSQRLAQRHGAALGAHARGQPKVAIDMLKQVAKDAPSAPQVYSSLGMVFEDMLLECKKRYLLNDRLPEETQLVTTKDTDADVEKVTSPGNDAIKIDADGSTSLEIVPEIKEGDAPDEGIKSDETTPDPALAEQLNLANKAYGSYHVAAILCKKDFTLWIRSADMASDIAALHGQVMALPSASEQIRRYHRAEKRRWQSEALRDYIIADNLKPPGIDTAAKLAAMHIELGNLSEALTILTDLKNRPSNIEGARSEFQSSYKAWMLYADLMLRIGHECTQWNRGIQTNDNYMVRRWLRKLSNVFDWQERRLQALSLALEAAAGTKSTERFVTWTRERALAKNSVVDEELEKQRWHLDTNHDIPHPQQHLDGVGAAEDGNPKDGGVPNDNDANDKEVIQNTSQGGDRGSSVIGDAPGDLVDSNILLADEDGYALVDNASTTAQFEDEKNLLLDRNASEVEAFDKTTNNLELIPAAVAAGEKRQEARETLIKSHRSAVVTLVGEYHQQSSSSQPIGSSQLDIEDMVMDGHAEPLSISASCRTVCNITSELMKHLHGLELYQGGRLAGESVSAYLKDRAALRDRRVAARRRLDEHKQSVEASLLHFENYDQVNNDESEDDDGAIPYLSDDDDLDQSEDAKIQDSLRKGALPPEIRVLFALSLIGEGGWKFVAAKCLEAIDYLEQEDRAWFSAGELETGRGDDPSWSLFRRAMTEPLGRTAAYSFVADVFRKTRKEEEWSEHFLPCFQRQLETLESVGLIDELQRLRGELTPFQNFRKNQVLKIFLAANRFKMLQVESLKSSIAGLGQITGDNTDTGTELTKSALKSLTEVLHLIWKVEADGAVPQTCAEVLRIFGKALRWLSQEDSYTLASSQLTEIVTKSMTVISFLGGKPVPDFKAGAKIEDLKTTEWSQYPIKSSWQPDEYRAITLRVYNLCVACNVSLFSGWESEEFTLRLLRRRHGNKHFGVHIEDGRIAGYLSPEFETEVARQWNVIAKLLPSFPCISFSERLASVREKEWFKAEAEDRKEKTRGAPIARYGEEDGVHVYLGFSALCLLLAGTCSDENIWNQLVQASLSVLMPISQFVLDFNLWDSDIGGAAAALTGFDEWKYMSGICEEAGDGIAPSKKPGGRRKRTPKAIEKKVKEWIEGTKRPTLQSIVIISVHELHGLWKQSIATAPDEESLQRARESMERLHLVTQQLRGCYTDMAIEKGSLQVAVALLDVASQPSCQNPFSCLQQAAVYASQGSKAGNSDMMFRHGVPDSKECSPHEALIIIGRADCLHAVYFPNEAAFLCSYVARVCSLHRDRGRAEMEWNSQWKIVAIYAYNVSVMIRSTVSTVLDKEMQKTFLYMWERDVVEELERGRTDALAWKRALLTGKAPLHNKEVVDVDQEVAEDEQEVDEEASEADDEDVEEAQNFDDDDEEGEEGEKGEEGEEAQEEKDNAKTENNNDDDDDDDDSDDDDSEDDKDRDDDDDDDDNAEMPQPHGPGVYSSASLGNHYPIAGSNFAFSNYESMPPAASSHPMYAEDSDDDSMENIEIVGV